MKETDDDSQLYRKGYEAGFQAGRRSKPRPEEILSTVDNSKIDSIIDGLDRIAWVIGCWFERHHGSLPER